MYVMVIWHTETIILRPVLRSAIFACQEGDERVEADARRVGQYSESEPLGSAQDMAGRLLTTVYMGTVNSSRATQDRADALAKQVQHVPVKLLSHLAFQSDYRCRAWCSW